MWPVTSRSSATPSMRQGAKLPCRNAFSSDSRRAMGGSLSGRGGGARAARPGRGELGDQPVAQKRDGGILGGEVAAGEQRGDTVRGAPAGARRLLDRDAQPAGGRRRASARSKSAKQSSITRATSAALSPK